jgi:GNAT superfamily N-acetyltransferase
MSCSDYTVKTMTRKEVNLAVDWAAAEGWNPGLHDADCFHRADPGGFLIGYHNEEPVSSISVVKYGAGFGFLGFYIVRPEYRRRGFGIAIWNRGMAYLGERNIGLDGVVDQQQNYSKSGFKLAHRNIRFEGQFENPDKDQPATPGIIDLSALHLEKVTAYDRQFFPADRARFVRSWVTQRGSRALGIIKDGEIAGYGVIRKCRNGFKVGPLFADNTELAESLFDGLRRSAGPDQPVYLDVPETNKGALDLVERYGMHSMFETARMYTLEQPDLPLARIFGITTFELG